MRLPLAACMPPFMVLMLALAGCGGGPAAMAVQQAPTIGRTWVDDLGDTLYLPSRPTRVVAFSPMVAEAMYALGQQDRLVAAAARCQYPPSLANLPRLDLTYGLGDDAMQALRQLEPDVVVLDEFALDNEAYFRNRLGAAGIPLVFLRFDRAPYASLAKLGQWLDVPQRGQRLADSLHALHDTLAARLAPPAGQAPKSLAFVAGVDPLRVVGNDAVLTPAARLAGAQNAFADRQDRVATITPQDLLAANPTALYVLTEDGALYDRFYASNPQYARQLQALQGAAAGNARVYQPEDLHRFIFPSLRTAQVAAELYAALYPAHDADSVFRRILGRPLQPQPAPNP